MPAQRMKEEGESGGVVGAGAGLNLGGIQLTAGADLYNYKADYRTQTVSIDPDLAAAGVTYDDVVASFTPWNNLNLIAIFALSQHF